MRHWTKVHGLQACITRFFNVYGPRSRTNGTYGAVMGVFFAQYLAKQPLTIVGNGEQKRDFVHVDDVCAALRMLMNARNFPNNETFNIGAGKSVSVKYLASLISDNITFIPKRPGEPDDTVADCSKIIDLCGWEPKKNLAEGVSELMADLSHWKEATVWSATEIAGATESWFRLLERSD